MTKKILIFFILINTVLLADFIRNDKSETVLDTSTNLLWLDTNTVNIKKAFLESMNTCKQLDIAGYKNWRVPNYNELYSLIDMNNVNGVLSDKFKNKSNGSYWTSTISKQYYNSNQTRLWTINLNSGHDDVNTYDYTDNYIRCVHSGNN